MKKQFAFLTLLIISVPLTSFSVKNYNKLASKKVPYNFSNMMYDGLNNLDTTQQKLSNQMNQNMCDIAYNNQLITNNFDHADERFTTIEKQNTINEFALTVMLGNALINGSDIKVQKRLIQDLYHQNAELNNKFESVKNKNIKLNDRITINEQHINALYRKQAYAENRINETTANINDVNANFVLVDDILQDHETNHNLLRQTMYKYSDLTEPLIANNTESNSLLLNKIKEVQKTAKNWFNIILNNPSKEWPSKFTELKKLSKK